MKNNLGYFFHYADEIAEGDMMMLAEKYGWEGIGRYYRLKEIVSIQEGCQYILKSNNNLVRLAFALNMKSVELIGFIDYLNENCQTLLINNSGVINIPSLDVTLASVNRDRKLARERKKGKGENQTNSNTHTENEQSSKGNAKSSGELLTERERERESNINNSSKHVDNVDNLINNSIVDEDYPDEVSLFRRVWETSANAIQLKELNLIIKEFGKEAAERAMRITCKNKMNRRDWNLPYVKGILKNEANKQLSINIEKQARREKIKEKHVVPADPQKLNEIFSAVFPGLKTYEDKTKIKVAKEVDKTSDKYMKIKEEFEKELRQSE